jgi:hypothetical protein
VFLGVGLLWPKMNTEQFDCSTREEVISATAKEKKLCRCLAGYRTAVPIPGHTDEDLAHLMWEHT